MVTDIVKAIGDAVVPTQGMLVLSRQKDEVIMIGDDIEVTVVDIRGDRVRIGVNAPSGIEVDRKEIRQKIKDAAAADPGIKLGHFNFVELIKCIREHPELAADLEKLGIVVIVPRKSRKNLK